MLPPMRAELSAAARPSSQLASRYLTRNARRLPGSSETLMPICASQGATSRLIRSTSSGSCSLQQRQLLRQDRHDQQHQRGERDQRRDLDQRSPRARAARGAPPAARPRGAARRRARRRSRTASAPARAATAATTATAAISGPVEGAPLRRGQAPSKGARRIRVAPAVNAGATGRRGRARAAAR